MFWNGSTAIDGLSGSGRAVAAGTDDTGAEAELSAIDAHRPRNVFQRLLAAIEEFGLDLAPHLAEGVLRDADPARFGDTLKACREIDPVAEDILALDQDVAEVDADAPFHPAFAGNPGITLCHQLLKRDRALHGADHRGELDQHAIAGRLNDPPAMFGNKRIGSGAMFAQQTRRTRLVGFHQPAVADHIGREDGGEAAVHPIRRSSLHGVLPGRAILYRGAPLRTTAKGPLSSRLTGRAAMAGSGAWAGVLRGRRERPLKGQKQPIGRPKNVEFRNNEVEPANPFRFAPLALNPG